jgi:hypothetical protein
MTQNFQLIDNFWLHQLPDGRSLSRFLT